MPGVVPILRHLDRWERGDDIPECCRNDIGCKEFNACTDDLCDEATGACSNLDVVCSEPPRCEVAVCDAQSGCTTEVVVCDDDRDLCTIESFDPDVGDYGTCVTMNVV